MECSSERALALSREGYNCSQAVFGAFAEECGLDFETAIRISSSFGGGIAQLREACGAFTGLCMAMGAKYGYSNPSDKQAKADFYTLLQGMERELREPWGTINCGELLRQAEEAGEDKPCRELIRRAAEITRQRMDELDRAE